MQADAVKDTRDLLEKKIKYKVKEVKGKSIVLFSKTNDRKTELQRDLKKIFRNSVYDPSGSGSSAGRLTLSNGVHILLKPLNNSVESLDIKTEKMVGPGKPIVKSQWPKGGVIFDSVVYKSAEDLKHAVIKFFKNNSKYKDIEPIIEKLFNPNNWKSFTWPEDIDKSERQQIAKYVGEVLIGYMALLGNSTAIQGFRFPKKASEVIFPMSANMKNIDSLAVFGAKQLPISSKSGVGAAASWFANIAPFLINKIPDLSDSYLKRFMTFIKKTGLQPDKTGNAIKILYMYGVKEILGLKDVDPLTVLEHVKSGKMSAEVTHVIQNINSKISLFIKDENTIKEIKSKYPSSVSGFFTRAIANKLNTDSKSIEQMKDVVAHKGFWQANLDLNKFVKDKAQAIFVMKNTDGGISSFKVTGNKGSLSDPSLGKGLLNYTLQ